MSRHFHDEGGATIVALALSLLMLVFSSAICRIVWSVASVSTRAASLRADTELLLRAAALLREGAVSADRNGPAKWRIDDDDYSVEVRYLSLEMPPMTQGIDVFVAELISRRPVGTIRCLQIASDAGSTQLHIVGVSCYPRPRIAVDSQEATWLTRYGGASLPPEESPTHLPRP